MVEVVKSHGYKQRQSDNDRFSKHSRGEKITIFTVYVDDLILTEGDLEEIKHLKKLLAKEFEIKVFGP